MARQTNPIPYCADYPGHKVNIDQNEKLVMYGVPHVAAVDGYSGLIAGLVTMPVKNPILVYDMLYRYFLANRTRSPTLADQVITLRYTDYGVSCESTTAVNGILCCMHNY